MNARRFEDTLRRNQMVCEAGERLVADTIQICCRCLTNKIAQGHLGLAQLTATPERLAEPHSRFEKHVRLVERARSVQDHAIRERRIVEVAEAEVTMPQERECFEVRTRLDAAIEVVRACPARGARRRRRDDRGDPE